jgi:hypothetical protein
LPRIDAFIARDGMRHFVSGDGPVKLIMNGWYSNAPENWPPSDDIVPLLTSMHVTRTRVGAGVVPADVMVRGAGGAYLRARAPVGARDLATLALMQGVGIDAYFSACLTLTLKKPRKARPSGDVLVIDVPDAIKSLVWAAWPAARPEFQLRSETETGLRFRLALGLLKRYAEAHFVITSRLHCALPCLAFGTPVAFVTTAVDQTRLTGLSQLLHVYNADDFARGLPFDIVNPLPNKPEFRALVGPLARRCIAFVGADCWSDEDRAYRAIVAALMA